MGWLAIFVQIMAILGPNEGALGPTRFSPMRNKIAFLAQSIFHKANPNGAQKHPYLGSKSP